jgi:hypothetical protein
MSHRQPGPPFGYAVCRGCGAAVQRRVLVDGHDCDPVRYAAHQARRPQAGREGFDEAFARWLDSPAGRWAQASARRIVPPFRPGEA